MNDRKIFAVHKIDESWNEQMLSIVRNSPIESSGLSIVFDRDPDILLLPRLRSKQVECAGFFVRDRLQGFAMMMQKEVYVKERLRPVLYFGNLYVDPKARGRGFFFKLSDFFLSHWPDNVEFGYAVIMQGNEAALRLLNRFSDRYPHMPHSRVIGQWKVHNILMVKNIKIKKSYSIRQAQISDLDAVADLLHQENSSRLFSSHVTKEKILQNIKKLPNYGIENYYLAEQDKKIVGVCCAWDMTPVKKNRVLRYGIKFKWVSCLYKCLTPLFRFPRLPEEGEFFRDVTITDYAVQNRDPEILKALLSKIYAEFREKKYHMLIFGCDADDPLTQAVKPFFSQSVVSNILVFSKSKKFIEQFQKKHFFWIDMALL